MVDGKKIILEIDGTVVEGEIMQLYTNDIEVMITAPFKGTHTGTHVPHFAMGEVNRLSTGDGQITARRIQRAESLLKEIYQSLAKTTLVDDARS
jgi:hypothetical protein